VGRFLQEDVYRGDGLNLYAYCANNPVMYYDPSGYQQECKNGTDAVDDNTKGSGGDERKTLYRGERATTVPEVVFEEGIKPKGTHDDALLHTKSNTTAGNFVSTTDQFDLARDGFAGKNGYVYVIETDNYVDINRTYGDKAYFPEQSEFSISGGIKRSEIKGAYSKEKGVIVGDLIPNPNYGKDN